MSVRPTIHPSVGQSAVCISVRHHFVFSNNSILTDAFEMKLHYVDRAQEGQESFARTITLASVFWSLIPLSFFSSRHAFQFAITQFQLMLLK